MYDCLYLNINDGVTDLPAMFERITECYVNNLITIDQYHELKQMAIDRASFSGDPGYEPRISNLESSIESHTVLINKLYKMFDAVFGESELVDSEEESLKDPSFLATYTDGLVAKTNSVWIFNGGVWKAVAPETYGLCWGPLVLPQFWENVSAEYDLTKLNVEEE